MKIRNPPALAGEAIAVLQERGGRVVAPVITLDASHATSNRDLLKRLPPVSFVDLPSFSSLLLPAQRRIM